MVKVHCNEGVAIHIGPKPCAGRREAANEASVGVGAGQILSRVSVNSRGPTRSTTRKAMLTGSMVGRSDQELRTGYAHEHRWSLKMRCVTFAVWLRHGNVARSSEGLPG